MATELRKPVESTSTVRFQDGPAGSVFKGKFIGSRDVKSKRGQPMKVHEFQIISSTAPITKRDPANPKKFDRVVVKEGDKVAIMGTTILNDCLGLAASGDIITITFSGVPAGKTYYNFRVERED